MDEAFHIFAISMMESWGNNSHWLIVCMQWSFLSSGTLIVTIQ